MRPIPIDNKNCIFNRSETYPHRGIMITPAYVVIGGPVFFAAVLS